MGQEARRVTHAFRWQIRSERSLYGVGGDAPFQPGGHGGREAAYVALGEVEAGVEGAEACQYVAGGAVGGQVGGIRGGQRCGRGRGRSSGSLGSGAGSRRGAGAAWPLRPWGLLYEVVRVTIRPDGRRSLVRDR